MNVEAGRLRTFRNWPVDAPVDARRVAKAGFYYMGSGLEVQCFSCGARISEWNFGDEVMNRHRLLDPGCHFVQNSSSSGNVPLLSQGSSNNQRSNLNPAPSTSFSHKYQTEEERLNSFLLWPKKSIISPQLLAESGFFFTQSGDRVQCAYCNQVIYLWEQGDEPDKMHLRFSPSCPYMRQRRELPNAMDTGIEVRKALAEGRMEDLGVYVHRIPFKPAMSSQHKRLQTYKSWPKSDIQSPEDLAEAGFFYTGSEDSVTCFHCGGGIKRWDPTDEPWKEHARWYPHCGFLFTSKGKEFIDACKKMNQEQREVGLLRPAAQVNPPTRVRSITEEEVHCLMNSSLARSALSIGIEASLVKRALKNQVELTGAPFSSTNELINAALDVCHNEQPISDDIGLTTPPPLFASPRLENLRVTSRGGYQESTSEDSDAEDAERRPAAHGDSRLHLSSSQTVTNNQQTNDDLPRLHLSSSQTVTNNQQTNDDLRGVKPKSAEEPQSQAKSVAETPSGTLLEEEVIKLREARLCKICMDNEVCILFLPCRHLVTCITCVQTISNCPLCREVIRATVRTFLP